jgi:hypothetical protein
MARQSYHLREAATAHRLVENTSIGKIILHPTLKEKMNRLLCAAPIVIAQGISTPERQFSLDQCCFAVEEAATCVNVIRCDIDKAEGVHWRARETDISLSDMVGVGDSPSDMKFMQLLGWLGAPASAHEAVKQIAHDISPYDNGPGGGGLNSSPAPPPLPHGGLSWFYPLAAQLHVQVGCVSKMVSSESYLKS